MIPVSTFSDFASGLDSYMGTSRDSMNVAGGGVALKQHMLSDMSLPQKVNKDSFEEYLNQFKRYKLGTRIQGIKVNTGYNTKNKPVSVIGRLKAIKIDRGQKTVRVFLYDPANNQETEIYADTIQTVNESAVKTFEDFIVKD